MLVVQNGASLENVLKSVFNEGLGTLQDYEAKLVMKANAVPRFYKARPVPYAIKKKLWKN